MHATKKRSAVFAVEQIPYCLPPGRIRFFVSLERIHTAAAFGCGVGLFGSTALRAVVREPGLIGLQLELF